MAFFVTNAINSNVLTMHFNTDNETVELDNINENENTNYDDEDNMSVNNDDDDNISVNVSNDDDDYIDNETVNNIVDVQTLLNKQKHKIFKKLGEQLQRMLSVKWYVAIFISFTKLVNNEYTKTTSTFHSGLQTYTQGDSLREQFSSAVDKINESVEKFIRNSSGWVMDKITRLDLFIAKYEPLYASSYIPTPERIKHSSRGIINIKNENDNKCFLWSILAFLHINEDSKHRRPELYEKYEKDIIMTNITYPVSVEDLDAFETLNSTISVNVFGYENDTVHPLRITKLKNRMHINLLLITCHTTGNNHYCLITSIAKLMGTPKDVYCNYCLNKFTNQKLLDFHDISCTPLLPAQTTTANEELVGFQSCTNTYVPTPSKLSNSMKSIVNIDSKDTMTFLWCILAKIYGHDQYNHYYINNYRQYAHTINMNNISYPVHEKDVNMFEKNNPDISINVFGYEDNKVYVVKATQNKGRIHHVNLLMLKNEENKSRHFCLITELSHFLAHLTKHEHEAFYCVYCLHRFSSQERLDTHLPLCSEHGAQRIVMPKGDKTIMKFTDYTYMHKVQYTVYADLESFAVPLSTAENEPNTSYSNNVAKHIPSGFCYIIIDANGNIYDGPFVYSGPDVMNTFIDSLVEKCAIISETELSKNIPINMTQQDTIDYENATVCHLCEQPLDDDDDDYKVKNHNHLTGEYLGAAHNTCNINYKLPKHIPVFFHNLKGYDSHHIMQAIGKYKDKKLECIATSSEKYLSITLDKIRFLDSLQFMNASLDTLVNNLAARGVDQFHILNKCHPQMGGGNISLLLRKGVYPYEYMTGSEKFAETTLPAKENFYNKITDSHISNADYTHAQTVWQEFNIRNLEEYHNLYLLTDVLLLADVFENFRKMSLNSYKIDPCNCYSAPGLAWQSMMRMTKVELELLTDIDQHLFIEKGIRGGLAMIPTRYARANNPLLSNYNDNEPTNYIMYFDCNNLYGTAMSQPLPKSNFEWMSEEEVDSLSVSKIMNIPDDAETGYILEVDLEYPKHLHELHSDYPLAPERMKIEENMLSPFNKNLLKEMGQEAPNGEKLLTTLSNKQNYIIHYRNLKLYIKLGLVLTKVHRALQFRQSPWLKQFIDFNTRNRQAATNTFEKDFYKLMNNAIYGKSLENVRKHADFKLVSDEKQLIKWVSSPRLQQIYVFNENLVGLSMKKLKVTLNRPIYAGFAILDISKLIMYNFHYNWAVKKYKNNIKLCMTDTDSLLYDITTQNIYQDILEDSEKFDTSDYPTDHPCYSTLNKKKLGAFKDEMNGQPILEFIGLRAKCYSILSKDLSEKKVAKGVPRIAIKKQLHHKSYETCLFKHQNTYTSVFNIRSSLHKLFTQKMSKLSLSPYDDKRYILQDGITTLPYGHRSILPKRRADDDLHPSTSTAGPPPPKKMCTV